MFSGAPGGSSPLKPSPYVDLELSHECHQLCHCGVHTVDPGPFISSRVVTRGEIDGLMIVWLFNRVISIKKIQVLSTVIYAKLISLVFNPKLITTMNKIPNSFARFPEETIGQHSDKCLCISFLEGKPKKVFFKRSLRRCLQLLGMGKACQALLKPHKI